MRSWLNLFIIFLLIFSVAAPQRALAALSFSDLLSTTAPGMAANHQIQWTVSDSGGIAENESFTLFFAASFDTSAIALVDIDLLADLSELSLAANCDGSEQLSFSNNGDDSLTLTVCVGDGGSVAGGSVVTLKIGANAASGVNRIINPAAAGGYTIRLAGNGGYSDADRTEVVILAGATTSAIIPAQTGSLRFLGYASPEAVVYFKSAGAVIGTASANGSGYFDKTITGFSADIHIISIYATDAGSVSTLTISFSISVASNTTTIASGIILPPTFTLSQDKVKRPAELVGAGRTLGNATVRVFVQGTGTDNQSINTSADSAGRWSANVNPKLHLGNKSAYSLTLDGSGSQSEYSQVRAYEVLLSTDLNVDNLTNLTDFSILMYNYGTSSPPNIVADINDNGPVDLVDFSVMMYHWTGG